MIEASQQRKYDSLKRENMMLSEEIGKLHQENRLLRQQIAPVNREVQVYTEILKHLRDVLSQHYLSSRSNLCELMEVEERITEKFADFQKDQHVHSFEHEIGSQEYSDMLHAIQQDHRDSEGFHHAFDKWLRASLGDSWRAR